MKTTIWFLMICDDYTALACDGLCYKTVHKWTILRGGWGIAILEKSHDTAETAYLLFEHIQLHNEYVFLWINILLFNKFMCNNAIFKQLQAKLCRFNFKVSRKLMRWWCGKPMPLICRLSEITRKLPIMLCHNRSDPRIRQGVSKIWLRTRCCFWA